MLKRLILFVYIFSFFISHNCLAQTDIDDISLTENAPSIENKHSDKKIENKLSKILQVTGWYPNLKLKVQEGIVILNGQIDSMEHKQWAIKLIERTEGVIAVVDQLDNRIIDQSVLKPASEEAANLYNNIYKQIPYILSGFLILLIFLLISFLAHRLTKTTLSRKNKNVLLVKTIANIIGFVFLILGFYLALKSSGLSTLAVSLLGGTGMLGLGIGLALKSSFENYASSIMISLKDLLKMGEVVNINGFEGVVQSVTTRGTTLMDYEGNSIIIPNSQVFNSVIKNLTRNPKMRTDFTVGIDYKSSIDKVREVVLKTLSSLSPNVLNDPEPIVAVDSLGAATVNLKIFFWFDGTKSSKVKLRSLVIQKVKEALVDANISMPDDAREVIFASSLKIENVSATTEKDVTPVKKQEVHNTTHTQDLTSEVDEIKNQAASMPPAEKGENVID